jgi:uncharacterized protein YbjT (DUF2867 family)
MDRPITAIVLGATGLVGTEVVRELLDDQRCGHVVALGRRRSSLEHPRLEQRVVDFEDPESWRGSLQGDVLFSALGTTIKKAGSQSAQHRVDYTYQLRIAEAAALGGVGTYVLVSATGADPQSLLFYSRMKGQLERDITALGFQRVCILRPGLLQGQRSERRPTEQWAAATLKHLPAWSGLARVRPIPAQRVARAALKIAFSEQPLGMGVPSRMSLLPGASVVPEIYEAKDLFRLVG